MINDTFVRSMEKDDIDAVIAFIRERGHPIDPQRFKFVFKAANESGSMVRLLSAEGGKIVGVLIGHCGTSLLSWDKMCYIIFEGYDAEYYNASNKAKLTAEFVDWAGRRRVAHVDLKSEEKVQ